MFLSDEMECEKLSVSKSLCDKCGFCRDVCPLGFDPVEYLKKPDDRCIKCLYCYSVCPHRAIRFKGELGFFREQLKQYDRLIRALFR